MKPKPTPTNPNSLRSRSMRDALRAYHAMGLEALQHFPRPYAPHGQLVPFAARFDVEPDTLRKARAFAKLFSGEELNEVLNPAGDPLSWGHVRLLVSVKSRKERRQLVRDIVKQGWTVRKLAAVLVERRGKTRRGRQPKIVTAPEPERRAILVAAAKEFLARTGADEHRGRRAAKSLVEDPRALLEAVIKHAGRLKRKL